MAEGFLKRIKHSITESSSDQEILEFLWRIDRGDRPTDAEAAALRNRKVLNLSDTPLAALPESIGQLASLQYLSLSNTRLTTLPDSIGQLASLRFLSLGNTRLAALPDSIGQLASLKRLNLRNTQLTDLPESFGQLTSLQVLDLRNTKLTALPESIGQLASLKELYLSNTKLAALPKSVGQLTNLRFLSLGNTKLTALPESIGQLASLQELYLGNTKLADLPESIGQLTSLRILNLRITKLTALPESIGQLASLRSLSLDYTQLAALPESIGQLKSLRVLGLSDNNLTTLPEYVGQLASLQTLYLGNTKLAALPEWLGELPELRKLDLRGLTLPRLPRSLARRGLPFVETDSYDFKGVNLYGVTLTEQEKAVFLQNDPALIEALYEPESLRTLRECRVIFLGDGDSGKSYTIRRFRAKGRRETEENPYTTSETPGVEILDEDVVYENETYTLHFWDFGGQQLLHAMHRCFLSNDSCYVVTVKSRETRADQRARYWLRNAAAFAPDSPVLLYVNCWDNDDGRRVLDERRLRKDFPNLVDVVYVSAKAAEDREFREKLMEPLIKMAASSKGCKKAVPQSWIAVRKAIQAESENRPYLDKTRYHELCAANGIEDDNAPALLSYFNTLGVCFSYHRDAEKKELADYRLLKPVWLTNAIYAVIEEGMGRAKEGRIGIDQISDMLCHEAPEQVRSRDYRRTVPEIVYQPEECSYIIDVAILHKLCYRVDESTLFFPALCPTDSPEEALAEPGEGLRCMEYRLKYSYLPDNVIHRLMIRCLQNDYSVEKCWLRGLILAHTTGPRVLVRMDDDETLRIDLWANPVRPASVIFLRLREELLRINSDMGLGAKEFIVDGDDQYSVVSLLRASEKGSMVFGNNSGEERDARNLLGDFYESRVIDGMRVENNAIVIPILPYTYHHAKKDDQTLRIALYEAYNHICPYCGEPLRNYREMEVDHIFPSHYKALPELTEYVKYLNDHGFDTEKPDYVENYFPAHSSCNLDKSNHTEPFALLAWHHRAARMAPKVLRLMEKRKQDE